MNLDEQIIMRLVAKISELDEIISKFATFKLSVYSELEAIQERVADLETQSHIILNKFEQSNFPSLLDEFAAYNQKRDRNASFKSTKKVPRRKKL